MMRLRTLGLALMAVVALSAVVASASASAALPELVEHNGKELKVGKRGFTSKGKVGETYLLETQSGFKIECDGRLSGKGKVTGLKTGVATIKFGKCSSVTLGSCTSSVPKAEKEGEIWMAEESELVYINKASKEVGTVLKPKAGNNFAEFECSGIPIVVRGSLIGPITTPINTLITPPAEFTLVLQYARGGGIQEVTEYENEKGEKVRGALEVSIDGNPWEQIGIPGTLTTLYEEAAEIRA